MTHSTLAAKRILVVEDDAPIADMLTMMLEMEGYLVDWAPSANTAINYLTKPNQTTADSLPGSVAHNHALILLDLQLPDMDGSDLVQRLADEGIMLPPVIVLSARREQAVYAAATRINAASVLTKPFQMDDLLREIHQTVR